jgi:hypothetical protein
VVAITYLHSLDKLALVCDHKVSASVYLALLGKFGKGCLLSRGSLGFV